MKSNTPAGMFFAFGLLAGLAAQAQLVITPVVVNRDPAPGTAPGVSFSAFQDVHIDDFGRVLFIGTLSGPGTTTTNQHGVWTGWPGGLELLARTGDLAPETEGGRFVFFAKPVMDSAGGAVFYATFRPPAASATLQSQPQPVESTFQAQQRFQQETEMKRVMEEWKRREGEQLCKELKIYENVIQPLSLSFPGFGFYPLLLGEKTKAKKDLGTNILAKAYGSGRPMTFSPSFCPIDSSRSRWPPSSAARRVLATTCLRSV